MGSRRRWRSAAVHGPQALTLAAACARQVRTQTLVKNAIIQVDATPFKQFYQQHYGMEVGVKKKSAAATAAAAAETKEPGAEVGCIFQKQGFNVWSCMRAKSGAGCPAAWDGEAPGQSGCCQEMSCRRQCDARGSAWMRVLCSAWPVQHVPSEAAVSCPIGQDRAVGWGRM